MKKNFGDALRNGREAKGLSQQQVADTLGVSRAAIGQWERGISTPSTANLIAICKFLDLSVESVTRTAGVEIVTIPGGNTVYAYDPWAMGHSPSVASVPEPQTLESEQHLPVFSMVQVAEGGDYVLEQKPSELTRRPVELAKAASAYAIYVASEVLAPRYEIGEMAVLAPTRPARIGDYVAVQLAVKEGERPTWRLGRLAQRSGSDITLEQFNPPRTIKMEADQIVSVHRIVPTDELL